MKRSFAYSFSMALVCSVFALAMTPNGVSAKGIQEIVVKAGNIERVNCPVQILAKSRISPGSLSSLQTRDGKQRLPVQIERTAQGSRVSFILPKLAANQILHLVPSKEKVSMDLVSLTKVPGKKKIDIKIGKNLLTSYCYPDDSEKPYMYPVIGPYGVRLTRGYPMENLDFERKLKAQDHPHHRSFWVAYGNVNGGDFWMMEKDPNHRDHQRTDKIITSNPGPVYGRLLAKNSWIKKDGQRAVSEQREYFFYNTPETGRVIDSIVTFTATDGDAHFGDTKEGGICALRLNPKIDEKHGNGTMRNSEGGRGAAQCWGKRADWCDYYGNLKGHTVGVSVFDHPKNLRHPTWWHIRDYGLYTANCFGLHNFLNLMTKEDRHIGDYVLPAGQSLTFRYRVFLHTGDTDQAKIAERYAQYINPPKAEIVWAK